MHRERQSSFEFEAKDEKPPEMPALAKKKEEPPHEYNLAEAEDCPHCGVLKSWGYCSSCHKYQKRMLTKKKK